MHSVTIKDFQLTTDILHDRVNWAMILVICLQCPSLYFRYCYMIPLWDRRGGRVARGTGSNPTRSTCQVLLKDDLIIYPGDLPLYLHVHHWRYLKCHEI